MKPEVLFNGNIHEKIDVIINNFDTIQIEV